MMGGEFRNHRFRRYDINTRLPVRIDTSETIFKGLVIREVLGT